MRYLNSHAPLPFLINKLLLLKNQTNTRVIGKRPYICWMPQCLNTQNPIQNMKIWSDFEILNTYLSIWLITKIYWLHTKTSQL